MGGDLLFKTFIIVSSGSRHIAILLFSLLALSLQARELAPIAFVNGQEEVVQEEVALNPSLVFVSLNCENLFDCIDDSLKDDNDFLPEGLYHWTPSRYWKKLNHTAQSILACSHFSDEKGASSTSLNDIQLPDIVALCEVESDSVMFDLTRRSLLRNAAYEYIITHSPDKRGVNVALLYQPYSLVVDSVSSLRIEPRRDMRPTRDILYVRGRESSGQTLHLFVVHAPSRSGGEVETRKNRALVDARLAQSTDSILAAAPSAQIIIAGDFNDYSRDANIRMLAEHQLTEVSLDAKGQNGAKGTYKFHGKWESLDHIFVSPSMLPRIKDCRIGDADFLLTSDTEYGGRQPFRNFRGIKWQDGFSDHLPLILEIR